MHAAWRLRDHRHCTKTEEPTQYLNAHLRTATNHRQHQQHQHALGRAIKLLQCERPCSNTKGPTPTRRPTPHNLPPALGRPHPHLCTRQGSCIHRRLRRINGHSPVPLPAPRCAQQHPANPCLHIRTRRTRNAWPTTQRSTRKKATPTAAQAPNNHRTRAEQSLPPRPIPRQSDRPKAHKASTHLRLRFAGPWPRAAPKKGAGIRPRKRVTKYVPRQLGDTVRDSKCGAPNGPFKKGLRQALPPAPTRPHGPKTNTPSPSLPTRQSPMKSQFILAAHVG